MDRKVILNKTESRFIEMEFELLSDPNSSIAEFLIIKVKGRYRDGAEGDEDAKFIIESMNAAAGKYISKSFILDLTNLRYTFGDYFDSIYSSPSKGKPIAIIVSDKCIEGMASLEGVSIDKFIDNKEFFKDESKAIEYLKKEVK
jgi:hypothetical protein